MVTFGIALACPANGRVSWFCGGENSYLRLPAWPLRSVAQASAKVYRIGLLSTGAPIAETSPIGGELLRGLAEHGYELDKNP